MKSTRPSSPRRSAGSRPRRWRWCRPGAARARPARWRTAARRRSAAPWFARPRSPRQSCACRGCPARSRRRRCARLVEAVAGAQSRIGWTAEGQLLRGGRGDAGGVGRSQRAGVGSGGHAGVRRDGGSVGGRPVGPDGIGRRRRGFHGAGMARAVAGGGVRAPGRTARVHARRPRWLIPAGGPPEQRQPEPGPASGAPGGPAGGRRHAAQAYFITRSRRRRRISAPRDSALLARN